jgi:hypothetical protein
MQGRMLVPRLLDSLKLEERQAPPKPHRPGCATVLSFLKILPEESMIRPSANMMHVI